MTTSSKSSTNFDLAASGSHLLHRAQQIAANRSAEALRSAGITLRQFSVLSAIAEEEGVSQSCLVDVTGIDRSTLADMAARMETAKLIKRVPSKTDARAKSLTLMASGRKALDKATPGVVSADEALLEALPASRRDTFLRALSTLVEVSEEAEAAPAPAPKPAPKPAAKRAPAKKPAAKKVAAKPAPKAKAKPTPKPKAKPAAKAVAKAAPVKTKKAKPAKKKKKTK